MQPLLWGLAASLSGAIGALFLKKGACTFSWRRPVNKNLVIGFTVYVITTIFFLLGLRDADLSFFYPFTALLYVFAFVLGVFVLKEKVTRLKVLGMGLIVAGILLNSVGRFA